MRPDTRYAKSGDVNIAYQLFGSGPVDLVFVPGFVSNVDWMWEEPSVVRLLERLGSFARVAMFDKRGTGLSDRSTHLPTLEERMDDVRAVMDAAGMERAALFGISEGAPMTALFGATYPERASALVLYGGMAKWVASEDYPFAPISDQASADRFRRFVEDWGNPDSLLFFAPSVADDPRLRRWWSSFLRMGASPSAAAALAEMNMAIDVRPVLPAIRVPTLVLHRTGDRIVHVEEGRYMARQIPGATYVELPGDDHAPSAGDVDALVDQIEEFLTGERRAAEPDRVLATVLFTDIVASTQRAAELGDRRWRDLLASHHAAIRRELVRFRGVEVRGTGDGFLATFDGPARAIRCAGAITEAVRPLGIEVRAGLHTGECELVGQAVEGIAVHLAARVAARAEAGEVLVSSTVKDLVAGSGIAFAERGSAVLKGIPGEWRLYAVAG